MSTPFFVNFQTYQNGAMSVNHYEDNTKKRYAL